MVIDSSFYQTCIDVWLGDVNLTLEAVEVVSWNSQISRRVWFGDVYLIF